LKIKHIEYYKQYAAQGEHLGGNDDKSESPKEAANKAESNNSS
jgi:hypothetical protein